ncbi:uncharacterized protein KY384_000347 [Bacidia gigantensis]|uniref:uncharacterized protein n=1 Tax=Bacidia gigantensis TaxID=2732470 RepID=UPI001D04E49B|nr:uncharacterized protein KY384_000347 [Bacidia gigantensis]KAG8526354.1 hypothetical protein KY384_000347 [Bacidia gigantensis]
MAFGGYLGSSLFSNAIAASPYLPQQYGYADWVPSQCYYAFAAAAGCFGPPALPQNNISNSVFQCLVGKDTHTLQNASAAVSGASRIGTWGFLPVTDGVFIQQLPSQQLLRKELNSVNLLVGNNADEGPAFTPQNVQTETDFTTFIQNTFPLFTPSDIEKARANNLYAESTFVCPSYWMAEAFTGSGRKAYKYQYSVVGAQHGADVSGYFGPAALNQRDDFVKAFMTIWGNFITKNDPSISAEIADGANGTGDGVGFD